MSLPGNFVVIDVETSGLECRDHGLLEIGAVRRGRLCGTVEELNLRVALEAGSEADPEALALNGIRPDQLMAGMEAPEAAGALVDWLREGREGRWMMGGKNPSFDYGFLARASEAFRGAVSRRTVDLHSLACGWAMARMFDVAGEGFATQRVYDELGVPPEPGEHHALRGARVEWLGFERLVTGRRLTGEDWAWALADTRGEARMA